MKPRTLEKYYDRMWLDLDSIPDLTPVERSQILRYRDIYTAKLANPSTTNASIVDALKEKYGIGVAQAYRDISQMEILLSSIRAAEKQYIRYMVVETLKESINLARLKDDPETMAKAAGLLGKYTRLDQEDQDPLPWEEIVPRPIEYVNDPTVLGLPAVKNPKEYVEKMKCKYLVVEDAVIIDEK